MREVENLLAYADHKGRCNVFNHNSAHTDEEGRRICNCGYAEALTAYNDAVAKMMTGRLAEANEAVRLKGEEHTIPV